MRKKIENGKCNCTHRGDPGGCYYWEGGEYVADTEVIELELDAQGAELVPAKAVSRHNHRIAMLRGY